MEVLRNETKSYYPLLPHRLQQTSEEKATSINPKTTTLWCVPAGFDRPVFGLSLRTISRLGLHLTLPLSKIPAMLICSRAHHCPEIFPAIPRDILVVSRPVHPLTSPS